MRSLDGLRLGVERVELVVAGGEAELSFGPVADDELQVVLQHLHPRLEVGEGEAVGSVFALIPAGAEAELEATAGDVISGRRELCELRRMPECRGGDHRAEP